MTKENLNRIIIPLLIILSGSFFAVKYAKNLERDYYFLFHKNKATANITNIVNDRVKSCVISVSYNNINTHQIENCDFYSDLSFGNKVQTNSIKSTAIYYTTNNPCDIYIIDYKSPTISIIFIRLVLAIIIVWTLVHYLIILFKNIGQINIRDKNAQ